MQNTKKRRVFVYPALHRPLKNVSVILLTIDKGLQVYRFFA